MALRITLGQYYPAQSPLHRMDPRAKLVCILVLVVTCFFINSPLQLAYGYAALVALVASSRVPLGKVLASTRALIATFAILSLFNLLVRPTGTPLAQLGPVLITTDGAWAAVLYTLRPVPCCCSRPRRPRSPTPSTRCSRRWRAWACPPTRSP